MIPAQTGHTGFGSHPTTHDRVVSGDPTASVSFRAEATAAGLTTAQIDRRIRRGHWVLGPVSGVYLLAPFATEPISTLAAVASVEGLVATRQSALALWGLAEHPARPIVAAAERRNLPNVDLEVHANLSSWPLTRRRGISALGLEYSLASMATCCSVTQLHHLVDDALRARLTTTDRVLSAFRSTIETTRAGRATLRSVVADRAVDGAVPLSAWSRTFADRLAGSGLPRPRLEWRVHDRHGAFVAQVDAAYPSIRVAMELDSVRHHFDLESFESDRARDLALARCGWSVDRFTWRRCVDDWASVVEAVRYRLAHSDHDRRSVSGSSAVIRAGA